MQISELERFAFNQARFVYHAQYTIERDTIKEDLSFEQAFNRIKDTDNGKKFLSNVSLNEMKREEKEPGSFMDASTSFGKWCLNDEYGAYVEDFVEK